LILEYDPISSENKYTNNVLYFKDHIYIESSLFPESPRVRLPDPFPMANMLTISQLTKRNPNQTEIFYIKTDKFAGVYSSIVSDRCFHTFQGQIIRMYFVLWMIFALVGNWKKELLRSTLPKEHKGCFSMH
jgi:hypothetical protein